MANRIEVEIDLNTGEAKAQFDEFESQSKKSGKKVGKNLEKGADKFKDAIGGLKTQLIAIAGSVAAAFAGRAVISAAIKQQEAVEGLRSSLYQLNQTARLSELENYASQLQSITRFGDEAILSQLAFAQAMGANVDQSKEILAAATDMSAALSIDLNSAVRNITKTLGGFAGELGEVIPELKNLTTQQLQSGEGIALLASKYAGFSQREVKTFAGSTAQLSSIFGDLLENIGSLVIKSPVLIALINELGKQFTKASEYIGKFGDSGDIIGKLILDIIKFGEAVNKFIVAPVEFAVNIVELAFNGLRVGIQSFVGVIAGAASSLANLFAPDSELAQNLNTFKASADATFTDFVDKTNESASNLFNFDFATQSAFFLENMRATAEEALNTTNALVDEARNKMQSSKKIVLDVSQQIQQGLKASFTQGVSAIGGALAKGEDAFDAFAKTILGILGDLAINIGGELVAIGIGIEQLKASLTLLSGGFAIAAGLALIALGGALKALSGGAGSIGSTAGAGGGGAAPAIDNAAPSVAEAPDLEEKQTKVAINVEGTVLDPVSVGEQIADVLNQAFDVKGTKLITT